MLFLLGLNSATSYLHKMLTEDGILALTVAMVVFTCCGAVLGSALCPCSCKPSRDCKRDCNDCRKDRERCRKRCSRDCDCRRERSDTDEDLVG